MNLRDHCWPLSLEARQCAVVAWLRTANLYDENSSLLGLSTGVTVPNNVLVDRQCTPVGLSGDGYRP